MRRCIGIVVVLATCASAGVMFADDPALKLRAVTNGAPPVAFTIELFRWSSEAERAPLLTALSAPTPLPPTTPEPAAGRGRGARGGRGAAVPLSPVARLAAAIKAAPTVGFIWGDGVTGYSIKYAWRSSATGKGERIVLVVDRRLGAYASEEGTIPAASVEADFTLLDLRIDPNGVGEGKTSLAALVVVDATAQTLALDGYDAVPALLKVTR